MIADPDARFVRGRDHISTSLAGGTAMMSVERAAYYAVDGVAERIWQLLESPVSVREVSTALQSEYDIDPQRCEAEVAQFLGNLLEEGLVEEAAG